jgi:centromere-localized protein 2
MPPLSIAAAEAQMLKSYLLNPASLPTIITLEEFRELFPANQQSHPEVKLLYRDLQFLRTVDTGLVEDNISKECRDGERQRRELYQAFHQQPHLREQIQAHLQADKDVQADQVLYGQTGSVPKRKKGHSKESLEKEMEDTIRYLEVDALVAKREADKLLDQLREMLATLRRPKSSKPAPLSGAHGDLKAEEAVQTLESLEQALARNSTTP